MLFTLLVFLESDMSKMELMNGLFGFIFIPVWIFLPESPRWLLAKGRQEEANKAIKTICHWNNQPYKEVSTESKQNNTAKNAHFYELMQYPGMRRNIISMCICWFGFSFGMYGMIYFTPSSQSNVYLVFTMPAICSLANIIVGPLVQKKYGRKIMLTGSLLISGILIVVAAFAIPKVCTYLPVTVMNM